MASEQKDRALIEATWQECSFEFSDYGGRVAINDHGDQRTTPWQHFHTIAAAADYTRKALAKVAEIESEIALEQQVISWLSSDSSMRSMYAQRTLERLQAALREARKGMKEGK